MSRKKAPYMMAMIIYRDKNLQTKKLVSRDILEVFAIQWKMESLQNTSNKYILIIRNMFFKFCIRERTVYDYKIFFGTITISRAVYIINNHTASIQNIGNVLFSERSIEKFYVTI